MIAQITLRSECDLCACIISYQYLFVDINNTNIWFYFLTSAQYKTDDPPRVVLEKLEIRGFKVVAMAGVGQTCIWTLHKPLCEGEQNLDSPDIFENQQMNRSGLM